MDFIFNDIDKLLDDNFNDNESRKSFLLSNLHFFSYRYPEITISELLQVIFVSLTRQAEKGMKNGSRK